MEDYAVRAIVGEHIKAFAARTTDTVDMARSLHGTWPTATAALGRVLTGASLLGMELKGIGSVTVRVLGEGPAGAVVAVATAEGKVRGYIQNPETHLPSRKGGKLDVGGLIGRGMLYVTKDLGLGEPYTGSVELVSGEIAEDLTQYLYSSEQTPSAVSLGVLVDKDGSVRASGGIMVQLLPGANADHAATLEEGLFRLPPVSEMIDTGMSPEEMLHTVGQGMDMRVLKRQEVTFSCTCSRQRLMDVLASLDDNEISELILQGKAEVRCHFCNLLYEFTRDELVCLAERN